MHSKLSTLNPEERRHNRIEGIAQLSNISIPTLPVSKLNGAQRFNPGSSPNMPLVGTPKKWKVAKEQASEVNIPTAPHPPPEKQNISKKGTAFPAESVGLLLDLSPPATQEQSQGNVKGYMKDLELLIPAYDTLLLEDVPIALCHPISPPPHTNQPLLGPPAHIPDSGGTKLNHESDLIDITLESAALGPSIHISSLNPIENTTQKNSKNSGALQEEAEDPDESDTGEIPFTLQPFPEPKKWSKRVSERRLQRQGDFLKW
ncbi:hypothetical protein HOY80DRAFT_197185 [Tuber brumale]|nr:hypothetical protein HOY80DRAFT_197185 [Tuber brumale]